MFETNIASGLSETYVKLKTLLLKNGCIIIAEEVPDQISVLQGSVWGVSPKAAKKNITFRLSASENQTRVIANSAWTLSYKLLTLIGSSLATVLMLLCGWIFISLRDYVSTAKMNYWSWLANTNGFVDSQKAHLFINLTEIMVVFLAITLIMEIMVVAIALLRKDSFAKESLGKFT